MFKLEISSLTYFSVVLLRGLLLQPSVTRLVTFFFVLFFLFCFACLFVCFLFNINLNVVYSHTDAQKRQYRNSRLLSDELNLATTQIFIHPTLTLHGQF